LVAELLEDRRVLHSMSTGPGDGGLTIDVDGYGAFGSAVSGSAGLAVYDPVGSIAAASTTFESGLAIRFGGAGTRQFLTAGFINGSGGLSDPAVTGTSAFGTSSFSSGGLSFELLQAVGSMMDNGSRTGSVLSQNYTITNTTAAPLSFELIRYIDGDLFFDGTLVDGGGRIAEPSREFLFETDAGGTGQTDTTFLGIDTFGGVLPQAGRYEIDHYNDLVTGIINGVTLDNSIAEDTNNDGFVDAGREYDVTLALRTTFSLAPGETATYVTRTIFGSGTPDDVNIAVPDVSAGPDVAHFEADAGMTDFVFNVSLSQDTLSPVTVVYSTVDQTATAPAEYLPVSGTLTFLPGEATVQAITVSVVGDFDAELNETFLLRLSNVTAGILTRPEAIGTILNDDVELDVSSLQVIEGDDSTHSAIFTVTAVGDVNSPVAVSYFTVDGTATAGTDYHPRAGALSFALGQNTRQVAVPIVGDVYHESPETFGLFLINAVDADIGSSPGVATIIDDDPTPALYVNDVHVTTDEQGLLSAVFTVALSRPSGQNVFVNFATSDITATSGVDYLAVNGGLVFAPGITTQSVTVPVLTNDQYVANKTFLLNLFGAVNASLGDWQGVGSIIFAPPPASEFIIDNGDPLYSRSSGWTGLTNTLAYNLDYDYHAAGNGSSSATWSFFNVPIGAYQVFAKWIPFSNRATNAPFTIYDGNTQIGSVQVNQQQFPTGDQSNGITWQSLGWFTTNSGILNVRLNDNANGYVVADAIRIVRNGIAAQEPEMDVAGFGRSVSTGDGTPAVDDGTDFGIVVSESNSVTHRFTISNNGNAPLHLTGTPRVKIYGADADDFTVIVQPAASVPGGAGTTFDVMFHPSGEGLRQAVISIPNDDDSEHPYEFEIQGTGAAAGPSQWIIDDQNAGFHKVGLWADNSNTFGYAGSVKTVAGGDGSNWARWTFGGLAPGVYDVYGTWVAFGNRATNAPFTIADGTVSQFSTAVNQQQWPGLPINGINWRSIGTIEVTTGDLIVKLTNQANGYVVADAVMIARQGAQQATLVAHNATLPEDVNGDRQVSSYDALLVISNLLTSSAAPQAVPLTQGLASGAGYYRDVSGDGQITPRDALLVISRLLSPAPQAAAAAERAAEPMAAPATSAVASARAAQPDERAAIDAVLSLLSDADAGELPPHRVDAARIEPSAVAVAAASPSLADSPWVVDAVLANADDSEPDEAEDAPLLS